MAKIVDSLKDDDVIRYPLRPEDIHISHNMRTYGDVPWGCWSCGSCECHHWDKLVVECDRGIKPTEKEK